MFRELHGLDTSRWEAEQRPTNQITSKPFKQYDMAAEQTEFLANKPKKNPNQVILEDLNGYDMFLNRDHLFQKPICRIIRKTDEYDNWITDVIYVDGEILSLALSDDGHDDLVKLAQDIEDKSWKAENSRPFNV